MNKLSKTYVNSPNYSSNEDTISDEKSHIDRKKLWYVKCNNRNGLIKMDLEAWLSSAAKWILPFFGILFIASKILGLTFSFGFNF